MSAITASPAQAGSRPSTVTWSVYLTLLFAVTGLVTLFVPGAEDIPMPAIVAGLVTSAIAVVICYPLWQCRKWAAIVITIITAFNLLSNIPAIIDAPGTAIVVAAIVSTPFLAVTLWLLWHPASRRAYRMAGS